MSAPEVPTPATPAPPAPAPPAADARASAAAGVRQLAVLDAAEKGLKLASGLAAFALAALLIWRSGLTEEPVISTTTAIYVPTPLPKIEVSGSVSETESVANGYILVIDSTPDEAEVTVNGEAKGFTPSSLNLECAPGAKLKLELNRHGYKTLTRQMVCKDATMVVLHAKLDPK